MSNRQLTERKFRSIVREEIRKLFEDDIGFEDLPPGWDRDSLMSFARSLTGKTKSDPEGFFTACMDEMEDKFDEPEKFCAALKDEYLQTTDWRGESNSRSKDRIS